MSRIKITCTEEQKLRFIEVLAGSVCPFMNKPCTGGNVDCFKCVEDEVDWEIVEHVKDFQELTIAEFEKHCGKHGGCSDCVYLGECAKGFVGRTSKTPIIAWSEKLRKGEFDEALPTITDKWCKENVEGME